jgi:small-conductance mechanosensitive channel
MDLRAVLAANFRLENLIYTALQVIFIAIVFEFVAWWLGRRIEAATVGLLPNDSGREHAWRTRRRTTLRNTPKVVSRTACYVVAGLLVLHVFGVPVLPLSIGLGAVALLFGSALLPLLRDATQGYALLADDLAAPGDVVEVNGVRGTVEKFTLRGLWLRDSQNAAHFIANRHVSSLSSLKRREEAAASAAFDPIKSQGSLPQQPQRPPV